MLCVSAMPNRNNTVDVMEKIKEVANGFESPQEPAREEVTALRLFKQFNSAIPKSYVQIRALCQSIMASADDEGIVRASRDMLMLLESRPREVIEFEARCVAATLCLAVSITVFFLGTRLPSPWLRSAVFPVLLSTPLLRWIWHSFQQQIYAGYNLQMDHAANY